MKIVAGLITFLLLALTYAHLLVDGFYVDSIAILLLILAALPWVLPYLKSVELPAGIKIELKDVVKAIEKVSSKIGDTSVAAIPPPIVSYEDPQFALIALRIDIERLLRVSQPDIGNKHHSLSIRVQVLKNEGILSEDVAQGLLDIIKLGNAAAHGAKVEKDAAEFIIFKSPSIIKKLQEQLKNDQHGVPPHM